MNKWEKEVQKSLLDSEEATLAELQKQYNRALRDIGQKVKAFQADIDMLDAALESDNLDDAARQQLLSQKRSKVYQQQYQKALQGQINGILDQMQGNNYSTIEAYLKQTYEDAYIGTMYDIHGQGIPIITPIDQAAAVKAVLTDSKISKGLYTALGISIAGLKKSISAEITRGIASSLPYADIARNLNNVSKVGYRNAKRIVVTEGHRIQQTSANDARKASKAKGADLVKQWDATLDGKTRPNHRQLDGQIREVDEPFEVDGMKAMFPGDFGDPAEDCNCRCAALTRARWALDEDELQTLKDRAEYFGLDKTKEFEDFKKKYLSAAKSEEEKEVKFVPAKTKEEAEKFAKEHGVKYVDYSKLPLETANELNQALATLPDDVRPVFLGDSVTLEKYWGGKLPRSSKQYYGVTIDTFDGIHLGYGNGIDFETTGQMVGISSSFKNLDKITAAKQAAHERYQQKYGKDWFFNVTGKTTPYHEMGHVYANAKGLPDGFEADALRWFKESGCGMLQKPTEAWAEAWAAYHTKANVLPSYISKYIEQATGQKARSTTLKGLISFDDDGIITKKRSEFKAAFESGKIRTIISPQKQARHIKGSKEFTAYETKMAVRGDHPSYIREDLDKKDLQRLVVAKLQGNVQVTASDGYREFVMCDEVIGYYYNKAQGGYVATKCAQVNYATGDKNIHIIPVKELKQGGGLSETTD